VPVYEYQCSDCGHKFDVVATLAEKEAGLKPKCPKCGRLRANQVFSRFTLLTGSKTEEDFGDEGDMPAGMPDMGGMGAMDGMDDLGGGDYDDLDDTEDI
jgi:putative FmdB family regulatory protein